jgi:hypothetical protein
MVPQQQTCSTSPWKALYFSAFVGCWDPVYKCLIHSQMSVSVASDAFLWKNGGVPPQYYWLCMTA